MPYSAVSVTVSPVVSNLVELSTAWLLAESDPVDWSEQVAVVVEAIDFLLSFDAFAALDIVDGVAGGSVFDEMHLSIRRLDQQFRFSTVWIWLFRFGAFRFLHIQIPGYLDLGCLDSWIFRFRMLRFLDIQIQDVWILGYLDSGCLDF